MKITPEERAALLRLLNTHAAAREALTLAEVVDRLQDVEEVWEVLRDFRDRLAESREPGR